LGNEGCEGECFEKFQRNVDNYLWRIGLDDDRRRVMMVSTGLADLPVV